MSSEFYMTPITIWQKEGPKISLDISSQELSTGLYITRFFCKNLLYFLPSIFVYPMCE